ncbi:extracellular superoxide dismutase [Cu-Zn]-like [Genypterus blacodes]|uniref:extracellular superoxide dismutase [Cu-Zn]-like n=1 Tax=Genypterus blacodes TaxID=154954 RepID=UPI003F76B155
MLFVYCNQAMHPSRSAGAFLLYPALLLLLGCQRCVSTADFEAPPEFSQYNGTLYAACKMRPSSTLDQGLPKVYGHVLFKQEGPFAKVKVLLRLIGFPSEDSPQNRAVHIHQYGDLSQGCAATGGHYNPFNVNHPHHVGDFGNFQPQQARINAEIEAEATLFGPLSVMGRGVVIHAHTDDLGMGGNAASLLHGNAGPRLGCCVIGFSSPRLWDLYQPELQKRQRKES